MLMPTYVYETIPPAGEEPVRFEIEQRMSEPALTAHPDTGETVRRVVTGGAGILCEGRGSNGHPHAAAGRHQHGPGCNH
jgi:predicted nucleic acid-binding Zn ribbon protein